MKASHPQSLWEEELHHQKASPGEKNGTVKQSLLRINNWQAIALLYVNVMYIQYFCREQNGWIWVRESNRQYRKEHDSYYNSLYCGNIICRRRPISGLWLNRLSTVSKSHQSVKRLWWLQCDSHKLCHGKHGMYCTTHAFCCLSHFRQHQQEQGHHRV